MVGEILLTNIPEVDCEKTRDSLRKKLSIRVQLRFENLVGSVIWGKKLCATIELK